MHRQNKMLIRTSAIVLAVILLAIYLRFIGKAGTLPTFTGLVRSFLYIGLYVVWGVSVWRRIVQKQARRYLLSASVLTVFWLAIRTMKFYLVTDINAVRQIWYAYYIPMLFIPLLALFVALSLGKTENSHLPKWTAVLYIPTTILVLLVLTNDLHQLVFTFPSGTTVWTDKNYVYNTCYTVHGGSDEKQNSSKSRWLYMTDSERTDEIVRRVIIDMKNNLFADAIKQALTRFDSDFESYGSEKPDETAELCRILHPYALIMEVTSPAPWDLEKRLAQRNEVKAQYPDCKIVFVVDENVEKKLADKVRQAKKDGLIDNFIYCSISTSYLSAVIDAL